MSRFYLRLILIPIVLFTALLLVIRTQPYDDHELSELLLPDGCPAPCFMGIRPGVTTKDETIKLLDVNKWVTQVKLDYSTVISWTWSGSQPSIFNALESPHVNTTTTMDGSEVAYEIIIPTKVSFGSIALLFDHPVSYMLVSLERGVLGSQTENAISLRYNSVRLDEATSCPSTFHDIMMQTATVTLYDNRDANFFFEEHLWDYRHFIQALKDPTECQ